MTRSETLLQKLAEWRPGRAGRQHLNLPLEGTGWAATVSADRCDELGCLVWEVTLGRTGTADRTPLKQWADQIAERASGLMESLKVVEVDEPRNEALLRSEQPANRNNRLFYYEVVLRGGQQALVRRYQASHQAGTHREQVAFAVTHEALAKLIGDLSTDA